ncbi:hypothetical protein COLO4_05424 [Corchorus olitorius]|uniref:Uncharacterized protein n=1 Tax=Corchorus olitorius TaxID=93759 RepID=A0A1R3KQX2_9ROSI|nr:hypothetical protein COLO4_05424 [Corchorus olitorius]
MGFKIIKRHAKRGGDAWRVGEHPWADPQMQKKSEQWPQKKV